MLTTTSYVRRGFVYSLHALVSIFAGLAMGAARSDGRFFLLGAALYAHSLYFAICYAICFHRESNHPAGPPPEQIPQAGIVFGLGLVSLVWFDVSVLEGYEILSKDLTGSVVAIVVLHLAVSAGLAYYIRARTQDAQRPLIRYRLLWPSLLSVAINLYIGLHIKDLAVSWTYLPPLVVVAVYVLMSELLDVSKGVLLTFGVILAAAATVPVITQQLSVFEPYRAGIVALADMLFCVSAASYLAVFDSWRVASQTCRHEQSAEGFEINRLVTDYPRTLSDQHYIGSLAALVVAGLSVPFYYVFTDRGLWFLFVAVHSAAAFYVWTRQAAFVRQLVEIDWLTVQNIFGLLFLAIVVVDAIWNRAPIKHWLKDTTVVWALWGFQCVVCGYIVPFALLRDANYAEYSRGSSLRFETYRVLFRKRMNTTRVMAVGALFASLVLNLVQLALPDEARLVAKIDWAVLCYFLYSLGAAVVEAKWITSLENPTSKKALADTRAV